MAAIQLECQKITGRTPFSTCLTDPLPPTFCFSSSVSHYSSFSVFAPCKTSRTTDIKLCWESETSLCIVLCRTDVMLLATEHPAQSTEDVFKDVFFFFLSHAGCRAPWLINCDQPCTYLWEDIAADSWVTAEGYSWEFIWFSCWTEHAWCRRKCIFCCSGPVRRVIHAPWNYSVFSLYMPHTYIRCILLLFSQPSGRFLIFNLHFFFLTIEILGTGLVFWMKWKWLSDGFLQSKGLFLSTFTSLCLSGKYRHLAAPKLLASTSLLRPLQPRVRNRISTKQNAREKKSLECVWQVGFLT